jgi:hypothetical protein
MADRTDALAKVLRAGCGPEDISILAGSDITAEAITFVEAFRPNSSDGRPSGDVVLDIPIKLLRRGLEGGDEFNEAVRAALEEDPPPELMDPISFSVLSDPVVISSGHVMNRSTVLDGGMLRFKRCPISQQSLRPAVYPATFVQAQLTDWRLRRLDAAVHVAQLSRCNTDTADKAVSTAEELLCDLGVEKYMGHAWRLADVMLAITDGQNSTELARSAERTRRVFSSVVLLQASRPAHSRQKSDL